jgi:hypothetical protein
MRDLQPEVRLAAPSATEPLEVRVARLVQVELEPPAQVVLVAKGALLVPHLA